MNKFIAAATVAAALTAGVAQATVITPAVEYSSSSTLNAFQPYTAGYEFTLSVPMTINALAYWNDGRSYSHDVGLWDFLDNLVVSTTVLPTDTAVGHFLWHSIAPITLAPGLYTIGGTTDEGGLPAPFVYQAIGVTTIPGYSWVTDEQFPASGLHFPSFTTNGLYGQNGFLTVNFSVQGPQVEPTPEPATLALFGTALAGYVGIRRRKRAA